MKKLIVIGGGPAGVTAAIYAKRAGSQVVIIDKGESALVKAGEIENYYGFENPISGKELIENGLAQAKRLGVEIIDEEIVGLDLGEGIVVKTDAKQHNADAIILATGAPRRTPKIKGIKEFEGKGVSYCSVCDGFFFKGLDVGVLGSGEYAAHEAEHLKPITKSVTMISGDDEKNIEEVKGSDLLEKVVFKDGKELDIAGLFIAQGSASSGDLAKNLGVQIDGNKVVVNENMETNVSGVFAAGDCTGGLMQVSKGTHEGAVAGLAAAKFLRKK